MPNISAKRILPSWLLRLASGGSPAPLLIIASHIITRGTKRHHRFGLHIVIHNFNCLFFHYHLNETHPKTKPRKQNKRCFIFNNMVGDWILDCGSLMICFEMSAMIMKQRTSCAGKYNVVVLVCVCARARAVCVFLNFVALARNYLLILIVSPPLLVHWWWGHLTRILSM